MIGLAGEYLSMQENVSHSCVNYSMTGNLRYKARVAGALAVPVLAQPIRIRSATNPCMRNLVTQQICAPLFGQAGLRPMWRTREKSMPQSLYRRDLSSIGLQRSKVQHNYDRNKHTAQVLDHIECLARILLPAGTVF